MHAVLKAGCVYVPVDPSSPPLRTAKMIRSVEPRCVIAATEASGLLDRLREVGLEVAVGSLDRPFEGEHFRSTFSVDDASGSTGGTDVTRARDFDLAHILFTSGSTGTPKGVGITHANVIHFVEWARSYFGLRADDRLSGHSPFHFDLSTFDIYGTLAAGAQLHLVPPELNLLPPKLSEFIRSARLTQWFSVPSVMALLATYDAVRPDSFRHLRRIIWCGEVMANAALTYWMQRVPQATFTNLYGPTEATIASSYYRVDKPPSDAREAIPIGQACPGEELLILDDELGPVPHGETGHLYIGGVGLSPGYWQDDEKTRGAFLPDPRPSREGRRIYRTGDLARIGPDGLVYFLGRQDSQVKTRGHRVELGEIEAALAGLEGLKEFAVVGVPSEGFEGTSICCAYARLEGADADASTLRESLRDLLPTYMLPTRWLEVESLPRNPNGKLDRPRIAHLLRESVAA